MRRFERWLQSFGPDLNGWQPNGAGFRLVLSPLKPEAIGEALVAGRAPLEARQVEQGATRFRRRVSQKNAAIHPQATAELRSVGEVELAAGRLHDWQAVQAPRRPPQ